MSVLAHLIKRQIIKIGGDDIERCEGRIFEFNTRAYMQNVYNICNF